MFLGVVSLVLHHLGHEIPHGFRRLILHLASGVGVGAQGEARTATEEYTGDGFSVSMFCVENPAIRTRSVSEV